MGLLKERTSTSCSALCYLSLPSIGFMNRVVFPSITEQEATSAAKDLFAVFRRSPIDKHTVYERHLGDVSRNLYDTVDDFVDEIQSVSDSYVGGYRNFTVVNRLENRLNTD